MQIRTLQQQTDKAYIQTLPRFSFGGKIVVVQSQAEVRKALSVLRRELVVGFDTETRPSFKKGEKHKVALLQLSTHSVCFLFRLNMIDLTDDIADFLADPSVLKVGLSLTDDLSALRGRYALQPQGWIDLQKYVADMGIADRSLQKLYANVFGKRISKRAQRSNWEAHPLSDSQKTYAATDAYTCLQLYDELSALRASGAYRIAAPATEENEEKKIS